MRCEVLLFAQLAEVAGAQQLSIELPDGATVGDALDQLAGKHEAIQTWRDRIAVAVDEQYRPPSASLTDGCTIALIPPVSGG